MSSRLTFLGSARNPLGSFPPLPTSYPASFHRAHTAVKYNVDWPLRLAPEPVRATERYVSLVESFLRIPRRYRNATSPRGRNCNYRGEAVNFVKFRKRHGACRGLRDEVSIAGVPSARSFDSRGRWTVSGMGRPFLGPRGIA